MSGTLCLLTSLSEEAVRSDYCFSSVDSAVSSASTSRSASAGAASTVLSVASAESWASAGALSSVLAVAVSVLSAVSALRRFFLGFSSADKNSIKEMGALSPFRRPILMILV